MSNTKEVSEYIYRGLGYPIKLENVRFYLYEGEWLPIIDVNRVALAEYHRLIHVEPEKRTKEHETLLKQVGVALK